LTLTISRQFLATAGFHYDVLLFFYSQYGCIWRKSHWRMVWSKYSGSSTEVCCSVNIVPV